MLLLIVSGLAGERTEGAVGRMWRTALSGQRRPAAPTRVSAAAERPLVLGELPLAHPRAQRPAADRSVSISSHECRRFSIG
jgi:hypothetical protein